jgi:hypothetical protein
MAGSDEVPEELVQPSRIYGMHITRPTSESPPQHSSLIFINQLTSVIYHTGAP